MRKRSISLPLILLAVLTLASGVLHGRLSRRWGASQELTRAAEKLEGLPNQFGDWTLKKTNELSGGVIKMLELAGYVNHTYSNPKTGQEVTLAIVLGPQGPIAVHTPEICYSSREFDVKEKRTRMKVESELGSSDELWTLLFESKGVNAEKLRVCYGWSEGREWSAPRDARFAFLNRPFLYKIQVASFVSGTEDNANNNTCKEFLKEFLPAVQQHLAQGE